MRGMASILGAASGTEIKGREKGSARETKAQRGGCARENERGGETGKRDEAEIQKVLTS